MAELVDDDDDSWCTLPPFFRFPSSKYSFFVFQTPFAANECALCKTELAESSGKFCTTVAVAECERKDLLRFPLSESR